MRRPQPSRVPLSKNQARMSNEALPDASSSARLLSWLGRRLQIIVVVAALAVIVVMTVLFVAGGDVTDVEYLKEGGYLGVFLLSFLGSVAMVLPVPGLIALCGAGGLGLSPALLGVLAGTGETIGEISGYAVGYGGRGVVEGNRFQGVTSVIRRKPFLVTLFVRLEQWMERRGAVVLFLVSIIPNPFFDLVGVAAGGVRYPVHRFFAIVFVGKILKGILVAYTCFYGVELMPWVD